MKYASSTFSFGARVALSLALASVPATGEYDCSVCYNLTTAQEAALANYDNDGKIVICDPTCLDESGVTDPTHCNYFGLGQICRGCGDCTTCIACPASTPITSPTSAPTPISASTPVPASTSLVTSAMSGHTTSDYDCSVCENLTSAQEQALASYDNGGKIIVCDLTCLDGISDPSHCNYFGLDQICRGCGNCSDCVTCPSGSIPSAADSTQTSAASLLTPDSYDCSTCFNLTTAQNEELTNSDDGEKTIVCDLTCLDGVSDPIHCNYFGLGQICRACGNCSDCTPCP